MKGRSRSWVRACGLLLLHLPAGCAALATVPMGLAPAPALSRAPAAVAISCPADSAQTNALLPVSATGQAAPASPAASPEAFEDMPELTPEALIAQVLARKP